MSTNHIKMSIIHKNAFAIWNLYNTATLDDLCGVVVI